MLQRVFDSINDIFTKGKLSIRISLLVALFSLSSWLAINCIFLQLPILVDALPEKWGLPSFLVICIQVGNVGPIMYTVVSKCLKCSVREVPIIYVSIASVVFLSLMLSIFWSTTSVVAGSESSTALLTITFFLAVFSCLSSVTYIPFMSRFKFEYLTPYYVGMGMCNLIPSLVALIQGVGSSEQFCVHQNITRPNSTVVIGTEPHIQYTARAEPLFGAGGFFGFLVALLLVSLLGYTGLNQYEFARKQTKKSVTASPNRDDTEMQTGIEDETQPTLEKNPRKESEVEEADEDILKENTRKSCESLQLVSKPTEKDEDALNMSQIDPVYQGTTEEVVESTVLSLRWIAILLMQQAWMSGLRNGVVPALLSYSCMPYGSKIYHLALTLSAISDPIACSLYNWFAMTSVTAITFSASGYTLIVIYIVIMAALSPCPILMGGTGGGVLMILMSMSAMACSSYLMLAVTSVMHKQGKKALLWTGASIQVGAFSGALFMGLIVNKANLFKQSNPCAPCS